MSPQAEDVLTGALALSPKERAELVERLLASFEVSERERVDGLWAKEAEDRIDAYERGELGARPASEVFRRIRRGRSL